VDNQVRELTADAPLHIAGGREEQMAQAVSISLSKFTSSVQAAVKTAIAKHPKFKVEVPQAVTVAFLIRGFPVPDTIVSNVTFGETQAFANDVAAHIAGVHPEAFALAKAGQATEGAVLSVGRHVICGIPPVTQVFEIEK
jgi:hypothetical protein